MKKVPRPRPVVALTKWWLYPYNQGTAGGTNLIKALAGKAIKINGLTKWKDNPRKIVINWGRSHLENQPVIKNAVLLNHARPVAMCANKLEFFKTIQESEAAHDIPEWTTDWNKAEEWRKKGSLVVARTVLNGHSGQGIVINGPQGDELPKAKLFTRYIRKDEEYRVHCIRVRKMGGFQAEIFYEQKKVKRGDFQGEVNPRVRCFDNGYTYQHNNIVVPDAVASAAKAVFLATNLDFGAVDVLFRRKRPGKFDDQDKAYVLEINTAPGLEGLSVDKYRDAFTKYFA